MKLLCRILLFSVKPQHKSAKVIHIPPACWTCLPSPPPSHPFRLTQSPCLSFLSHTANSHWLSILHMVMEVSMLIFLYSSPSPPLSHVHKSILNNRLFFSSSAYNNYILLLFLLTIAFIIIALPCKCLLD